MKKLLIILSLMLLPTVALGQTWGQNSNGLYQVGGNVGISTSSPSSKLDIDGYIAINGQPLSASSVKFKSKGEEVLVSGNTPTTPGAGGYDMRPALGATSGVVTSDTYFVTPGNTYIEWWLSHTQMMVRQNTDLTAIEFYACSSTGTLTNANCTSTGNWQYVTDFQVKLWRFESPTDTTMKLVGIQNICPGGSDCVSDGEIVPGEVNKIAIDIPGAQVGDILSIALTKSSSNKMLHFLLYNLGNGQCRQVTSAPATTGLDWYAQTAQACQGSTSYFPKIRLYGTSPINVIVGDSIAGGLGQTICGFGECRDYNFTEVGTLEYLQADFDWAWQLSELLGGETYQNMGDGGATTTGVEGSFVRDVIDLKPRRVIIQTGTNDVSTSVPIATFQTKMTSMFNQAKAVGIQIVVNTVPPASTFFSSDIKNVLRYTYNEWIKNTLAPAYNAIVVDTGAYLGSKFDLSIADKWTDLFPASPALNTPTVPSTANGSWYYVTTAGGATAAGEPTWCPQKGCTVTDGSVIWTNGGTTDNDWVLAAWADAGDGVHPTKTGYAMFARAVHDAITSGNSTYGTINNTFPNGSTSGNMRGTTGFRPLATMITPTTTAIAGATDQVIDFSALSANAQRTGVDSNDQEAYGCDTARGYCKPTLPGDYQVNAKVTISTGLADTEAAQITLVKDNPYYGTHDTIANSPTIFCASDDINLVTTEGLITGLTLYNATDGSSGTITVIGNGGGGGDCPVGTNNKVTVDDLTGGVDNTFAVNDNVMIVDADCGGSNATVVSTDHVIAGDANTPVTLNINRTVTVNGIDDWIVLCTQSESASTIDNGPDNTYLEMYQLK